MEKGNEPDNIKKAYRTAYLVAGFLKESLTEPEKQELEAWINESEHNKKLFADLTDQEKLQQKLTDYNQADTEYYLQQSKERLNFNNRRRKTPIWKYGVAASIIACVAIIWIAKPFSAKQNAIAIEKTDTIPNRAERWGKEQAILLMENGETVLLDQTRTDSAINDQLSINDGRELVYQKDYSQAGFHTLTVPRQGFYHLRLPDGTKVSLNASSSLRYPTRFTGNERRVYMTGEAYFEVAPNAAQPFRVDAAIENSSPLIVEAVGTAFNINTYTDEPSPVATLVEGKVNVSLSGKGTVRLIPNQQASVTSNGLKVGPGNVDVITAWTKNKFLFVNTPLDEILRQFARWYNVEFVYQGSPNPPINAPLSRNLPIEDVLRVLSKTEEFNYRIEGQRITITK